MPYIKGKDLYKNYCNYKQEKKQAFPEDTVKFYAAQIVLAIGELHSTGIVHRDLKLENVMIDDKGFVKVIDYGLAKKLDSNQKTLSHVGTAEYKGPEMLMKRGHDKRIDWWTVGILTYEMRFGVTPFMVNNPKNKD